MGSTGFWQDEIRRYGDRLRLKQKWNDNDSIVVMIHPALYAVMEGIAA